MAWRTTSEADDDLAAIALQGAESFGRRHAEEYLNQIIDMFEILARHPEMAPERQAAIQIVRLMPHGAHHILYIIDDGDVFVLRVLHRLQDWFGAL